MKTMRILLISIMMIISSMSFSQSIVGNTMVCVNEYQEYVAKESGLLPVASHVTWNITSVLPFDSITSGVNSDTIHIRWIGNVNGSANLFAVWTNQASKQVSIYKLPTPTISGTPSVCKNSTNVEYETEPNMTNYSWTIQGGTITSGQGTYKIKVTWTSAGSNKVTVNYSNTNGCTAQSPTEYLVTVHDLPQISIVGDDSVCGGRHIYTAEIFNPIESYTYNWEVMNGAFWSSVNGATCDIGWDNPGVGMTKVKVTSSHGCESNTQMPVVIFPTVTPSLTGNINTCVGTPNTYSTDSNNSNYNWTINGGTILSGQGTEEVNVVWNISGYHSISVSYVTSTGCTAAKSFDILIINQPISTISGVTDTVYMTSSFYRTEADMLNYNWIVTGGEIIGSSISNLIEVNWSTIGTGVVTVNYDLPTGCHSTTATKNVSISPSICMVTYDTAENKNRIYVNTVPNTFDHYNIYMLNQSVYEKIGEMPISENSYLDPTSQPLIISNSYKVSVVNGVESPKSPRHTTIYLSYTIQGNMVYLHWTPYYGFEFTAYHIFKRINNGSWNEIGTVSNTIFDATDTYSNGVVEYYIQVSPLCIPTLKSSNSTITIKSNIQKVGSNGIFENNVKTLKVYPNPTRETLNVDLENGVNYIEVYDMNGKVLDSSETSNDKFTMNVSSYPVGLYLIKVKNDNKIYIGKFNKIN